MILTKKLGAAAAEKKDYINTHIKLSIHGRSRNAYCKNSNETLEVVNKYTLKKECRKN